MPLCRRLGLAKKLIELLETITVQVHDGYFVDLFVRKSNATAINMYMKVSAPTQVSHASGSFC